MIYISFNELHKRELLVDVFFLLRSTVLPMGILRMALHVTIGLLLYFAIISVVNTALRGSFEDAAASDLRVF